MSEVRVTEELSVPADRVWALVRDFGGIRGWLGDMVQGLELKGEGVGMIRTITLPGNTLLHEQLKEHDDAARRFSYAIVGESPLPIRDYLATFELSSVGEGSCRIDWSSTFEPVGISEEEAKPMIEGIYTSGIAALRATLGI